MKVFESRDGYLVRLVQGEEIHTSLIAFASERALDGATVEGIGAVRNVVVGFYNLQTKEYERREFPDNSELVSLSGNLCRVNGNPFLHAHATMTRADFSMFGGHLFQAEITATGEFAIHQADLKLTRVMDPTIGLPLLETESK